MDHALFMTRDLVSLKPSAYIGLLQLTLINTDLLRLLTIDYSKTASAFRPVRTEFRDTRSLRKQRGRPSIGCVASDEHSIRSESRGSQ